MCGILGTVNRAFGSEILDLIRHRGPDDASITQELIGGHLVTLGHRRLSIVDLSSAGRQPMRTCEEKHSIVFNGEIYNHLELRERASPVSYRGHSDTETILNCLAQEGVSAASQFNGIFAFGFADAVRRKLFLARDPFGVKPLYYCFDRDSFLFSSEIRPLLTLVDDSIEIANLAELLRLRYLPAPHTLFKKIRKVRPGHIIEVDLSRAQLSLQEYSFAATPPRGASMHSHAEAVEQYAFLVEQAVKRQLMSDVKVGVFLSGGVDSALIASMAQKHSPYVMPAFTVGFQRHEEADETDDARESARIVGLEHHEIRLNFQDFLDTLPRIANIVEEPLATTSAVPMFHLAELASRYGKVVLSGQGADEAMGGYRRYRAEVLRDYLPHWAAVGLESVARMAGVRNEVVLRGLESLAEPSDLRRFETAYGVFAPGQIGRLIGHTPGPAGHLSRYFFDLLECSGQASSAKRMMTLDLRTNLADDLLLYTDKITMHHSIECRVPFLDLDLVRFAESLPQRYRVGIMDGKLLHKECAERLLPASIVRRGKKSFISPTKEWFRSTSQMRDILLDSSSRFASYFDLEEVDKVLVEHASGRNRERHIFLLLSLHFWMAEQPAAGRREVLTASAVPR